MAGEETGWVRINRRLQRRGNRNRLKADVMQSLFMKINYFALPVFIALYVFNFAEKMR